MEPSNASLEPIAVQNDSDPSEASVIPSSSLISTGHRAENQSDLELLHQYCMQLISNTDTNQPGQADEKGNIGQDANSILKLLVTNDLSSIKSPDALRAYFLNYLHSLPPQVNSEILSVLIAIVKKSVFYLESARGLLLTCISYISCESQLSINSDKNSASKISLTMHFSKEWINLLVTHSCDVEELKSILKCSENDPSLLGFLQQANIKQRNRPHAFFAFPGSKGSMISLPPFQRWPTSSGWSFSTWFFLEPKACAQPYLFNFKTGKSGLGYSAYFTGNCLVLTSIRVKGKGVQHCVAYEFPSYKWIHCAITYSNRWRSSEIKVYVDGQLTANIEMPWQVNTNELFDKCYIGGSGYINQSDSAGDLNCLCGRMSALYLFNEGLSATQICALHRLGPSYMGQFKYSNESHVNLPPQICKTLYDEKLASSLFCLFTPNAVDSGTLSIQLAPFKSSTSVSAQNYFVSSPHAALLGETKAITTQPVCSTLQSLGCSKSLLPLLDVYAQRGDSEACSSLIGFLCDLFESSQHWFANEIVQNNGFVLIACSLANNARVLLSEKLLDIFLNLTRTLISTSSTVSDSLLLKHLIDNILFNPSLWIYAHSSIQLKLYSYLSNELVHGTRHSTNKYSGNNQSGSQSMSSHGSISNEDQSGQKNLKDQSCIISDLLFGEIRRVSTVLQSLHALKYYYWIVEEQGISHKARNLKLRPNKDDLRVIRMNILSLTKELIANANVTPLDEIQGLLNFLSSCSRPENLIDALDTLSSLLLENPVPIVAALDQKHGIRVLLTLIGSTSELVCVKSIRLLSLFLSQCSCKKKQEIMGPNNLFMLLCDRLRAHRPMSLAIYEALIDLMVEENSNERQPNNPDRHKEISQKVIVNSTVIKVVANLISEEKVHKSRPASKKPDQDESKEFNQTSDKNLISHDTRRLFINDLWNLIVNSRENRRTILQMSVWQHWLINLITSSIDDSPLIRDQVLAIFRVLLYHAIRYEFGGWRVWIDTLAIIHSKVSFDEFCSQIDREQQEDDHLTQEHSCKTSDDKIQNTIDDANQSKASDDEAKKEDETNEEGTPSKQAPVVSSISEHILNESRGIEIEEGRTDESAEDVITSGEPELTRQQSLTSIPLDESSAITNGTGDLEHNTTDLRQDEATPDIDLAKISNVAISNNSGKAQASPAFRIPEFKWGNILVKLLNDLLFSIECDLYHWRCMADLTSLDAPPFMPKTSYGPQSSTSSSATTQSTNVASHLVQIIALLQKEEYQIYIVNVVHLVSQLADNVIIAAGGLLPLLAEATGGSRTTAPASSVDSRSNSMSKSNLASETITSEGLTIAQANSLLYRLASIIDMVIFAAPHVNLGELEADKNTTCGGILRQCLRLACTVTVKNCLILRALQSKCNQSSSLSTALDSIAVDFPKDMFDSYQGCSLLSANGLFEHSALTLEHTDLIANLEYSPHQTPNTSSMPSLLPFQTIPIRDPQKLLQPIDLNRIQASIYHHGSADSRQSQFLALSSLYFISVLMVSKYRDIIEPSSKSSSSTSDRVKVFNGTDTSKTHDKTLSDSPIEPSDAEKKQTDPVISSVEANLLNFGRMQPLAPSSQASTNATSNNSNLTNMLTTKLESTLDSVCPLLKSIMCDFCQFLSRTLLGSHGQDLVNKEAERTFKRSNTSPVELVMLLCSQEWQNTLQKNAGLAFIELINEGRVLSHGMKDHIVRVALEAEFILSRLRADDVAKHEHFGLACSETLSSRLHEEMLINSLISSAARRDFVSYCKFKEYLANEWMQDYKLDIWEDDDRRRRRFVFDCWPNSSQLFYSRPNKSDENVSSEAMNSSNDKSKDNPNNVLASDEASSCKQILDFQKTLELGVGLEEHCPSSASQLAAGEHSALSNMGASITHGVDDDDDEDADDNDLEDDDDDDEVEDEEEDQIGNDVSSSRVSYSNEHGHHHKQLHHGPSKTGSNASAPNQSSNQQLNTKRPLSLKSQYSSGIGRDTTTSDHGNLINKSAHASSAAYESQQNATSASQWDYDDFSSVNDLTGSVIFAAEASLVWNIYTIPGVLQITANEIYFEPNQNIVDLIDSLKRDIQNCAQSVDCTEVTSQANGNLTQLGQLKIQQVVDTDNQQTSSQLRKIDLMVLRYCDFLVTSNGKIQLADVRAIFSRHYLLQPNALEIFIAQRTSVMFAFNDSDIVRRVVKYLPPVGVGIKYGINQSRRASLMSPRQLFAASNMTQRWQRREIGNFQYLMFLNTIAGRTYQDLNQYPVFPWILTNYESDQLDLTLPANFRDLSKPVGALNSKCREEFIERYQSWDNPKVPAFHYGTHYSTAAFTLNWLCRLRGQCNSAYLALQDGKYEEESRLFLSMSDSWVSSLVGSQQNVKELIPEFFYLPEMFHSNLELPKVELPAWAKGSAEQFVRMHRIALESELVSCQLHQWIDLIFGYKQRGPEAVNSVNTFYYLTYQGNVNLNMIKDPSLREAIETQIKHFGQTPSQLSTEPHPPRFSALHAAPLTFTASADEINRVIKFPFNHSIMHISSCLNNYIAAAQSGGASAADSQTTGTVQQHHGATASNGTQSSLQGSQLACPASVLTITSNNQYQIHKWQPNEQNGHPLILDPQLETVTSGGGALSAAAIAANRRQLIDVDDLCTNIYLKLESCYEKPKEARNKCVTVSEVKWPCAHYIVTLNGKYIIMGSFYDNSFRVFTTDSGKLCQVIFGHRAPITCLARSEGNAVADFYVATGSQDCSLMIWYWNERYAQIEGSGVSAVHNPLPKLNITGHSTPVLSALISAELGLIVSGSKDLILVNTTSNGENLLQIPVKLPNIVDRSIRHRIESKNDNINYADIPRPQVDDKERTILEASMLGDQKDRQRLSAQQKQTSKDISDKESISTNQRGKAIQVQEQRLTQLSEMCAASNYYVTNLQLARELAFIVCVALPAPRCRQNNLSIQRNHTGEQALTLPTSQPPSLLITFNLKGSLMDCATIGLAGSGLKLGDTCVMTITRDGEHLILNDSSSTLKIYKTFGLEPVYAYNTSDVYPDSAARLSCLTGGGENSRIRSLALLDHRYVLVGLDNGKLIVYNCDFKNL